MSEEKTVDTTEEVVDETTHQEDTTLKDPPKEEVIDWKAEAEKAKSEAEHAKKVAEDYRKEIEVKGLRKKDREIEKKPETTTTLNDDETALVKNDYLSKREDVIDEMKETINGLSDEEWNKIKPLVTPALDQAYFQSVASGKFVSRGEIKRALSNLIDYAKGDSSRKKELEKSRLEGIEDQRKMEMAELSGTKITKKKGSGVDVTEEDKKYSAESEGLITPERAAEIRLAKEKRAHEFAPQY